MSANPQPPAGQSDCCDAGGPSGTTILHERESIVQRAGWIVATGLEHLGLLRNDLELAKVSSAEEFASYLKDNSAELERRRSVEGSLIPSTDVFHVRGFCILCGRFSPMRVGYEYSFDDPQGADRTGVNI